MTTRLYYTDSGLRTFDAVVTSCAVVESRHEALLDRTAFYPTSGGQPCDTGRLGSASVIDVFDNDEGDVVHVLDQSVAPGTVARGEIDWPRRFDHMQQHTGQHLLSAAFDRLFGVRTVSFHLGAAASTIDLAREVTGRELDGAEAEANRVVWENRPVDVRFATADEVAHLPLRKEPARTGTLRIVQIDDFDLSACGGTHVSHTGMVGLVAITGAERFKGASRVSFACGGRALRSHGMLRDVVLGATRVLSVTPPEVQPGIERLQAAATDAARTVRRLQEALAGYRAADLRSSAEAIGGYRGVLRPEPELDGVALKGLASAVVEASGLVAVFTGRGTPLPVVIARSADVGLDAVALLRELTTELGGRGGGTPVLAQGGLSADAEHVLACVRQRISRVL